MFHPLICNFENCAPRWILISSFLNLTFSIYFIYFPISWNRDFGMEIPKTFKNLKNTKVSRNSSSVIPTNVRLILLWCRNNIVLYCPFCRPNAHKFGLKNKCPIFLWKFHEKLTTNAILFDQIRQYCYHVMENTSVLISGLILNGKNKILVKISLGHSSIFYILYIPENTPNPNRFSKVSSIQQESFLGSH